MPLSRVRHLDVSSEISERETVHVILGIPDPTRGAYKRRSERPDLEGTKSTVLLTAYGAREAEGQPHVTGKSLGGLNY